MNWPHAAAPDPMFPYGRSPMRQLGTTVLGLVVASVLALALGAWTGVASASDYVDRYAQQVAGTLDVHWEMISAPPNAPRGPVGCQMVEFTDGTLADAADGTVSMTSIGVTIGACAGPNTFDLTMAPDGLSLSGTVSGIPMTLTRQPDEAAFVGDWVGVSYVFRAHIAADPFPIPDYDPTWLGEWIGEWTDLNDPEFLGSVEMVVEIEQAISGASLLAGTLTWDCLFGDECGAVQQFDAAVSGGFAEVSAVNVDGVENFTDGQYAFTRSADGLTIVGERLDDPVGRDIRITMHRVANVAVPTESATIQSAVDGFATRPTALRFELAPGTYNENVDLASLAGRTARTDLVGMGATPDSTVIDDGVEGINTTILETSGAGSLGLLVLENFTVTGGHTVDTAGAGLVVSTGDKSVVVRGCEIRGNTTAWSGGTNDFVRRGGNATLEPFSRARFESTTITDGASEIWGGGLYVNRSDVVVVDCDIANNQAADGGGVVLGSGFRSDESEVARFLRTRIRGNSGTSTGAGLFVASYSQVTIEDCEFLDNSAASDGIGGAINAVYAINMNIRRTLFARNVAGRHGGALNLSGWGSHLVEECVFGGAPGDGNVAGVVGGGLVVRGPDPLVPYRLSVLNSTFSHNSAAYGGGIGLYTEDDLPVDGSFDATLTGVDFESNSASVWGGGFLVLRSSVDSGSLVFDDCAFRENSSGIGGGLAVAANTDPVQLNGGEFDGNQALNPDSGGGGVYVQSSAILMNGVRLVSNAAARGGGALLIAAAGSSVDDCVFGEAPDRGNTGTASGGGLYTQPAVDPAAKSVPGTPALRGSGPIVASIASKDLAAGADRNTDLAITRTDTDMLAATGRAPHEDSQAATPLARRAVGDPITVSDTVFEANSAAFGGGLIHIGAATEEGDLQLERIAFRANAADYGGGLYSVARDDEVIADAVEFRGNQAVVRGGGVEIESGSATFTNGVFFANVVTNDATGFTGPFGGGALSIGASDPTYRGSATLINTAVVGNRVDGVVAPGVGGGGLLVSGDVTVFNGILHGNESPTPSLEKWQIELDPTAVASPTADVRSTIVQGFDPLGSQLGPGPIFGDDPAFQDAGLGDLRPTAGSPAINAGNVAYLPAGLTLDLDGNPRVVDTGVDLGPYEFGVVTAVDNGPSSPRGAQGMSLYPNPFNPRLSVAFTLAQSQDVRVSVFDARGRRVRVLHEGRLSAGPHALTWDGTDGAGRQAASGNYRIELRAGERRELRSAVLVK